MNFDQFWLFNKQFNHNLSKSIWFYSKMGHFILILLEIVKFNEQLVETDQKLTSSFP